MKKMYLVGLLALSFGLISNGYADVSCDTVSKHEHRMAVKNCKKEGGKIDKKESKCYKDKDSGKHMCKVCCMK